MTEDDDLKSTTKAVLDGLSEREAEVLKKRFGIDASTDMSLDELLEDFDITRERIRALERKALDKLRGGDDDPDSAA